MSVSKIVAAAASSAGGAGLDVDEVFSTYLYTGNNSTQTITNGIDLSGEGGLVWTRSRSVGDNHRLTDTERGVNKGLDSSNNYAEFTVTGANGVSQFNNNGFISDMSSSFFNNQSIVAWTFRKQPKFFDVVTYTGNGNSSNTISHNLGSIPGFVVVKRTDSTGDWHIAARQSNGSYIHGNASYPTALNLTSAGNAVTSTSGASDMSLTSTTFDAKKINGYNSHNGSGNLTNINGATYVAYLFAHNDSGDGEFGPDSDQDIIKCGSYNTDGNGDATVNLGFEPQFVLVKCSTTASNWYLLDTMRGMSNDNPVENARLYADTSGAESSTGGTSGIVPTSTGFFHDGYIAASQTFIYMAIRRGPLAVPDDATKVFAPNYYGTSGYVGYLGAPADMSILGYRSGNSQNAVVYSRLTPNNKALVTSSTGAEITTNSSWDNMFGVTPVGSTLTTLISWTWKRAPGFFDVVAWTGASGTLNSVKHNLGVKPELVILKYRGLADSWYVYNSATTGVMLLDSNGAPLGSTNYMASTTATDLNVTGLASNPANSPIAYLFATCPGVSKVGSVTHSGSSTDVDCGFASGARFVLLKRTDDTGSWVLFDSVRGITSGNDPYLKLNSTAAEVTTLDQLDPLSSGFQLTGDFTDGTYIFYAIA